MEAPKASMAAVICPKPTITDINAEGRWESEGGATPGAAASKAGLASSESQTTRVAVAASGELDARQEDLMAMTSSDGRPPPGWLRRAEWRWFAVGGALIVAVAVTWIVITRANVELVAGGLVFGLLLMFGASPVLAAAMQRGREERAAKKQASVEREGRLHTSHANGSEQEMPVIEVKAFPAIQAR